MSPWNYMHCHAQIYVRKTLINHYWLWISAIVILYIFSVVCFTSCIWNLINSSYMPWNLIFLSLFCIQQSSLYIYSWWCYCISTGQKDWCLHKINNITASLFFEHLCTILFLTFSPRQLYKQNTLNYLRTLSYSLTLTRLGQTVVLWLIQAKHLINKLNAGVYFYCMLYFIKYCCISNKKKLVLGFNLT